MKSSTTSILSSLLSIRGRVERAAKHNKKMLLFCDSTAIKAAIDHYANQSYWLKSKQLYQHNDRTYVRITYNCPHCGKKTIQPENYCSNCGAALQLFKR